MNNQVIIWLLLIVPWLSLLLIKKDDIRRYLPSAFFTVFACIVIYFSGIYAELWYSRAVAFPFVICGLMPVITLWVFKFSYGHFLKYIVLNSILDLGFAFVILPWFAHIGIFGMRPFTSIIALFTTLALAAIVYGYQKWQEKLIMHMESR